MKPLARVNYQRSFSKEVLTPALSTIIKPNKTIFVCVGTDQSTGDALGPLVGSELIKAIPMEYVIGTLDAPIHANNLVNAIEYIKMFPADTTVIGTDSALGLRDSDVGEIILTQGKLTPGRGVGKKLQAFGDYRLCGVVNVKSKLDFKTLQETRLSVVMSMAKVMSESILDAWRSVNG